MAEHQLERFGRSFIAAPHGAERVGPVTMSDAIRLTVVLKPAQAFDPQAHAAGQGLSREAFATRHASKLDAVDSLMAYAAGFGLTAEVERDQNTVVLSGTYEQACRAFPPDEIGVFTRGSERFVARSGHLAIPESLAGEIVAILGFDQRPVAQPRFRPALSGAVSYDPVAVARRYNFPTDVDGTGQTIALIELGGGYSDSDVAAYFAAKGITRTGTLVAVPVGGGANSPDGNPNGADGEVQLDIDVAGSVAPGANIAVYFGPNQADGFYQTVKAAVYDKQRSPAVISISWGSPETTWSAQEMDAMDQLFQAAATLNVAVTAASGDNGSTDNSPDGQPTTDFPSSSPSALGCGGTTLPRQGAETAWNNPGGGATGGGYSKHFSRPAYQAGMNTNSGRGVPDIAGDADPQTGYNVRVDGQAAVVGGTSAVAPLWAALIALLNQKAGRQLGFINPVLYQNPAALTDITSGSNGAYAAGPGWDPVTGLGTPLGDALARLFGAAVASAAGTTRTG